jgi:hypothetical protein
LIDASEFRNARSLISEYFAPYLNNDNISWKLKILSLF